MNDRELLALAAKASGELTPSWYGNDAYFEGVLSRWNPLEDDGDALRARIEAAEKEVAHIKEVEFPRKMRAVAVGWETKCARLEQERTIDEQRIADLMADLNRVGRENEALRARIEAMEQQEPFDADSDVFRSAFEAALKAGNWPATRQGDGYRSPSTQIAWRIAFSTVNRLKLYALPGAKGE